MTATVPIAPRGPPPLFERDLAVGFGSVWVTDGTSLVRVDTQTNSVVASIGLERASGLAVGAGAVWVVGTEPGSTALGLLRIDPVTYSVSLVSDEVCASRVAADESSAWAMCVNTLVHVDTARDAVTTIRGIPAAGYLPGFGAL